MLLIAAAMLLGQATACQPQATATGGLVTGSNVGNLAPDFSLPGLEGTTVTLSGWLGRPVMLNFWSIECIYCVEEMPLLQTIYTQEASKNNGVVLLTLNVADTAQGIESFFGTKGYNLPTLVDSGARTALAYGVSGIPDTFFIDRKGVIRASKLGSFSEVAEIEANLDKIR